MTATDDDNVFNLAILGTFDDGQAIVKSIFNDLPFKDTYQLGAINSINWARVAAQIVYYFKGYFAVTRSSDPTARSSFSTSTRSSTARRNHGSMLVRR